MSVISSVPLKTIHAGFTVDVDDVIGEPALVGRLAALGVRPGSRVQIIRPGTPCLIEVGGSRMSVRCDSGVDILVRPITTSAAKH